MKLRQALVFTLLIAGCGHPSIDSNALSTPLSGQLSLHVRADSFYGLGESLAASQASQSLCFMTHEYVALSGQASFFYGATGERIAQDTMARFWIEEGAQYTLKNLATDDEMEFLKGFVDGFNKALEARRSASQGALNCAGYPPLRQSIDDFQLSLGALVAQKRLFSCAQDYSPALSKAAISLSGNKQSAPEGAALASVRSRASTNWAFGGNVTKSGTGILLAQPHDIWWGYYPARLTVSGQMDIFAILNHAPYPQVFSWTNGHVASAITCQYGQPYAVYALQLVGGNGEHYLVDGREKAFVKKEITISLTDQDGRIGQHRTQFKKSDFGWLIAADGFDGEAYALRYVGFDKPDIGTFPINGQITKLRSAAQIMKRYATAGRNDSLQFAFADRDGQIATTVNDIVIDLSPEKQERCRVDGAPKWFNATKRVPLLSGTRSDCAVSATSGRGRQTAQFANDIPALVGRDVYMGSNHGASWLDPMSPLSGYMSFIDDGPDQQGAGQLNDPRWQSLRHLLSDRANGHDGYPGRKWTADIALERLLDGEGHWARLMRDDVVDICESYSAQPGKASELEPICSVLRNWDLKTRMESRGAVFWRTFWASLPRGEYENEKHPSHWPPTIFATPYDPADPFETPRGIATDKQKLIVEHLLKTQAFFKAHGVDIDVSVRKAQFFEVEGLRAPIAGCSRADGCQNLQVTKWTDPWRTDIDAVPQTITPDTYFGGIISVVYAFRENNTVEIQLGGPGMQNLKLKSGFRAVPPVEWASKPFLVYVLELAD